jgi:hypothetical protein
LRANDELRAIADERLRLIVDLQRAAADHLHTVNGLQATADERLRLIEHLQAAADDCLRLIHDLETTAAERLGIIEQLTEIVRQLERRLEKAQAASHPSSNEPSGGRGQFGTS